MFWDGMLVDHWCVIEFAAQLGRMYSQPGGILMLVFIPYKIERRVSQSVDSSTDYD